MIKVQEGGIPILEEQSMEFICEQIHVLCTPHLLAADHNKEIQQPNKATSFFLFTF